MKKFVINVVVFTFILGILNLVIKLILNDIYFDDYNNVELDKNIYLLADSHGAALGKFENSNIFNFSAASDSYYDLKLKLKFLIRKADVKIVLLSADDHILSPYRDNANNKDRSVFFSSGSDFTYYSQYIWDRYIDYNLVLLNSKYGSLLKNYLKSGLSPAETEKDENWDARPKEIKRELSIKRFEKQFAYNSESENSREDLREIIKICKENNINLLGIKFPISEAYNQIKGNHSYKADEIFKENDLKILNFNQLKSFQNDSLFKDQDHLSKMGARKLRKVLMDLISSLH